MRPTPSLVLVMATAGAVLTACGNDTALEPTEPGSLQVSVVTDGDTLDPNGYRLMIDNGPADSVGVNTSIPFTDLTPGPHRLELSDVAANCAVESENPISRVVPEGGTAEVRFSVSCRAALRDKIVVRLHGPFAPSDDLFTISPDDGTRMNLTNTLRSEINPAISPDGTQIAFAAQPDNSFEWHIFVMNADGSGKRQVTSTGRNHFFPSWSPDGQRIAFQADSANTGTDIFTIGVDGTGRVNVTNAPDVQGTPVWSPDGEKIAFVRFLAGSGGDIFIIRVDGTELINVTSSSVLETTLAYSPDGSRIAFGRDDGTGQNTSIWIMAADGSNATQVVDLPGFDFDPDWSPDGTKIVFYNRDTEDIFVTDISGSAVTNISNSVAWEISPRWSRLK